LPTRTHGAYLGPLAEVVFLRQGNLWLAEIGAGNERQLTFEVGDWTVDEYVLDGLRIFYLARRWTASRGGYDAPAYAPQETIGRLLDLTSGEHRTLLDDLPPGSAHILAARPGEVDVLIAMRQALRVDLVTGEREPLERAEESRLSPDGRYEARLAVQLAGHTAYPAGELRVTDHEAGEDWSLDVDWYPPEDAGEHWFRGWSPDGRYLLVAGRRKGPGAIYETLCLADLSARTTHVLNPTGEIALRAGAWAPGADLIYASGCRAPEHANLALRCSVGVVDPESEVYAELEHPLPFEAREIAWLDGEWLLFTERRLGSCDAWRQCGAGDTMVWAARRDGSALSPVLWAAGSLQVLEKSAP